MNELYAFWKCDIPPYLLGGRVAEVKEDGYVIIEGDPRFKYNPVKIVPLNEGIKLQKKLNKAEAKYRKTMNAAKENSILQ